MKAVMYHYVRLYDKANPNFRFLDFNQFKKQLDFFENNYGFVTRKQWEEVVLNRNVSEMPKGIVLTFDDAMLCHYKFVYKELKKRDLWGIFYVPTSPYIKNSILDVHKIHILNGKFDALKLLNLCNKIILENNFIFEGKNEFEKLTYLNQNYSETTNQFKRILNYFLSDDQKSFIIERIAKKLNYEFRQEDFYVTIEQLNEMQKNGMIIGSHSNTHPLMSKLSLEQQMNELNISFDFLETHLDLDHRTYCHPYGGFHSFNKDTVKCLQKIDVKYSFNVESQDILSSHILNKQHSIPRYDCNEFSYGHVS